MKFLLALVASIFLSFEIYAQQYFTGLIFDDEQYDQSIALVAQSKASFENLPDSFSLKQFAPKAGNQIRFGTSVGWAAAWGARTILEAQKQNWVNVDEITQNAFSPIFAYQMSRKPGDDNCTVGSKMEEVLSKMKYSGAVKYVDFLEFCPDEIPADLVSKAKENRITEYNKLFETKDKNRMKIDAVRKSLSQGFPVVVGMYCPSSFLNAKEYWQPLEVITNDTPGHAVTVVGYDNDKYGGAFEVLNSWGRNWGIDGYTWIRYEDFTEYIKYGYQLILAEDVADHHEIFGSVQVLNDDNREISATQNDDGIYELNKNFRTGDRFRVNVNNFSRGYLYIIGSGTGNDFSLLFPHNETVSPGLVYKSNNLSLPDEQHFIQVTGDETEDFLYLIFSIEHIDIEYFLDNMRNQNGKSQEIVSRTLGSQLLDKTKVNWDKWNMSFTGKAQKNDLLVLTVKFSHD